MKKKYMKPQMATYLVENSVILCASAPRMTMRGSTFGSVEATEAEDDVDFE